jgi:transmembrane sensor
MTGRFANAREARIAREAADWHSRMLEPVSTDERAAFDQWKADPRHARAYAEIARMAVVAQGLPRPVRRTRRERFARRSLRPALAFGASALLLAGGLGWAVLRGGDPAEAALINSGPATRVVRLGDGTIVALDTGAHLTFAPAPSRRAVTVLAGRARFDVARGSKPFVVNIGDARISAGEARLDASLRNGVAQIVLFTGTAHVAVPTTTTPVTLRPGTALTVAGDRIRPIAAAGGDAWWPLARTELRQVPLSIVVARANAVSTPPIRLSAGIEPLPVTAILDLRDTRSLAPKLAAALDLTLADRGDHLLLARAKNF